MTAWWLGAKLTPSELACLNWHLHHSVIQARQAGNSDLRTELDELAHDTWEEVHPHGGTQVQ